MQLSKCFIYALLFLLLSACTVQGNDNSSPVSSDAIGNDVSSSDIFSENSESYIADISGQELADYYTSISAEKAPPIIIVSEEQKIPYTVVKAEDVSSAVIENGAWFVKMAKANMRERAVIGRDDIISITFPNAAPETVMVVDHWLNEKEYITPMGTSVLGAKYIPEEMPDMVQKNTTEYPLSNRGFHFSTGYYKSPNEHYLSTAAPVKLRGIQLKCEIEGQKYEYYFLYNTYHW